MPVVLASVLDGNLLTSHHTLFGYPSTEELASLNTTPAIRNICETSINGIGKVMKGFRRAMQGLLTFITL
ncbi:MAG: hypothetical protein P8N76_15735 [Pirellulaceae bacterium]|nr:hypothetical protein [Pirellulaceae bacterium]